MSLPQSGTTTTTTTSDTKGHIISMLALATSLICVNAFELLVGQPRPTTELYAICGQNLGFGAFMAWYHSKVSANANSVIVQT